MKLYVCFLQANSELLESHVLNRAASWLVSTPNPMIHTEILFAEEAKGSDISGYACSIHYGSGVFLEQKRFRRADWQFREIPCSAEQIDKAFDFCQDRVGDSFNYVGYYLHPFCSPRVSERRWFCSEIVAGALNAADVEVAPSLHPQRLYDALKPISIPACPRRVQLQF